MIFAQASSRACLSGHSMKLKTMVSPSSAFTEISAVSSGVADIRKAVADSIAYCDSAYKELTDRTAGDGSGASRDDKGLGPLHGVRTVVHATACDPDGCALCGPVRSTLPR